MKEKEYRVVISTRRVYAVTVMAEDAEWANEKAGDFSYEDLQTDALLVDECDFTVEYDQTEEA